MHRVRRFIHNYPSYCLTYIITVLIAFLLITAIVLLIWYLRTPLYSNLTCPITLCSSSTRPSLSSTRSSSITSASTNTLQTSIQITSSSSTELITGQKRTYKESCNYLYDCYTEYGLMCEYGWHENRTCLCEGSHYWSAQQNKCLRKGEINDSCEVDYQCHREIGFVCDKPPGASTKTCVCAASIYWAKDSNCGQTMVRRIVDCINENYATTCLVLGIDNLYHMLTIRSFTEKELSFDWFLVDNRVLNDLPQLSCTFNNDTKYCFGLNIQDSQHSLQLAQFTRKGFHSIENIGGSNQGTAFGLTDINNVTVYARNSQNTFYRVIIADDEILTPHEIAASLLGDPMCYIQELSATRQIYCFARNSVYGLTEYAEISAHTWRVTQMGSPTDRVRDETAPICSYVGQTRRYCFAIFENGQIYRILFNSGAWSTWQLIGRGQQVVQFISQPVFLTSKPLNQSSPDQTCYLIAIDTNNNLQLSTNADCASVDNFSDWIPIPTNLKFRQFDKVFRLRDGNVGVLGIDSRNQPYYLFLDSQTNRFTPPRPVFSMKPEQFRP